MTIYDGGWLPVTRGACFKENAVSDFTGAAETLRIREVVVSPKSADGTAFIRDESECRVVIDGITQFFKFPINASRD